MIEIIYLMFIFPTAKYPDYEIHITIGWPYLWHIEKEKSMLPVREEQLVEQFLKERSMPVWKNFLLGPFAIAYCHKKNQYLRAQFAEILENPKGSR